MPEGVDNEPEWWAEPLFQYMIHTENRRYEDAESFVKNLIQEATRLGRSAGIKEAMEAINQLPTWPDPATDLDNGISAMFDSGLITQYKHDKEKHEQDLQNLKSRLEYLTIKEV